MESRKRLYKMTKNAPTLTERVKQNNNRRGNTRNNAFNANRKIDLDDSVSTPHKPAPIKVSQIKDKPEKLRAYIELKRTAKFKETVEARSPFIPYVPVGRWVEKKEESRRPQRVIITTPVRKALLGNEKILKKTTIKQLATTAKKDTAAKKAIEVKPATTIKSRKKILCEVNSDPAIDLNNTFELLTDDNDDQVNEEFVENAVSQDIFLFESKSSENNPPADLQKQKEQSVKKVLLKKDPIAKVQVKKDPVVRTTSRVVPVKKVEPRKVAVSIQKVVTKKAVIAKVVKPVVAKVVKPIRKPVELPKLKSIASSQLPSPVESLLPSSTAPKVESSDTYKFYKSSYDIQIQYLTMHLKNIDTDKNSFIEFLSEDDQTMVYQIVQHGNKIVNDKMKNFLEFLDDFETSVKSDVKRCTKADVENYFDLIYDDIEKFKEELTVIEELKAKACELMEACKKKKRRTRIASDATPRRSRRIADHQDSPMNHSCFGCTPMSASKPNTPRSAKKRRTLFKNKELKFN